MKSPIGEQVHLNVNNYIHQGTARFSSGQVQDFVHSYNAQKKKNEERVNALRNIDDQLLLSTLQNKIEGESNENWAKANAIIDARFNSKVNILSTEIQKILLKNIPDKIQGNKLKTSTVSANSLTIEQINEARQIRNQIYSSLNYMHGAGPYTKEFKQSLQKVCENFERFLRVLGITSTANGKDDKWFDFESLQNKDNKVGLRGLNTLAALKEALKGISLSDAEKATRNGQFGETLMIMVGEGIKRKGVSSAAQYIKKQQDKQANNRSGFKIDTSQIVQEVGDELASLSKKEYTEKTKFNIYRAHQSQDKVDVSIELKGVGDIQASVKAYSVNGNTVNPHLQDVSLLYSLLATEEQFGNHWLNLHALQSSEINANKKLADEELEEVWRYEALVSGNLLKQGASLADSFVLIDMTNHRVFAKSTKTILTECKEDIKLAPRAKDIIINNTREDNSSYARRIAKIVQQTHQTQIAVTFRVNFKNIMEKGNQI